MKRRRVASYYVACDAANLQDTEQVVAVPRMLAGTGAASTWVPEPLLHELGIRSAKKATFQLADGRTLALLGARTLLGFGARVDPRAKRLVASGPHLAALVRSG